MLPRISFPRISRPSPGVAALGGRVLLLVLWSLSIAGSAVHAQPTDARGASVPFSRLAVYAGGTVAANMGTLHDFYHAWPGAEVDATTPFYIGTAGVDLGLRRYEARPARAENDFWAAPIALRWGIRPALGARLQAETAIRTGTLLMRFSEGSPGQRNESELFMGADAGLSLHLGGRWRLIAGLRYEHLFTSTQVDLWHVRAGLRRTFESPSWLRTLLR